MKRRSKAARHVMRRQWWELRRWKLARWIVNGIFGGAGERPENSLTVYATPSGAVRLHKRLNTIFLGLNVYEPGTRLSAESALTPQQAASLADALLYWVQRGELPERIMVFGDLGNPNVCPHGYMICDDCRREIPEEPAIRVCMCGHREGVHAERHGRCKVVSVAVSSGGSLQCPCDGFRDSFRTP